MALCCLAGACAPLREPSSVVSVPAHVQRRLESVVDGRVHRDMPMTPLSLSSGLSLVSLGAAVYGTKPSGISNVAGPDTTAMAVIGAVGTATFGTWFAFTLLSPDERDRANRLEGEPPTLTLESTKKNDPYGLRRLRWNPVFGVGTAGVEARF